MSEVPTFSATLQHSSDERDILPPGGQQLWPGYRANTYGDFKPYELVTAECELGRVALVGSCFAETSNVESTLERAIDSNNLTLLTHYPGSYAAYIAEPHRTTVLSSISGGPAIYYSQSSGSTVVSTQPSHLRQPGTLVPDPLQLAAHIADLSYGVEELFQGKSSFEDIAKLPGASELRSAPGGAQLRSYESLAPNKSVSYTDAIHELRQTLIEAVAARFTATTRVSSAFSGGIDSTSIAFLAAAHSTERTLPAYFNEYVGFATGDEQYAAAFSKLDNRFDFRKLSIALPSGFSETDLTLTPQAEDLRLSTAPYTWRIIKEELLQLQKNGVDVHLTGSGGDEIGQAHPDYLADVLTNRQFVRFIRETIATARLQNEAPFLLGKEMIHLALDPAWRLKQIAELLHNGDELISALAASRWFNDSGISRMVGPGVAWLTPAAKSDLADAYADLYRHTKLPHGIKIGDMRVLQSITSAATAIDRYWFHTHAAGVDVSKQSPLLDNNVIRAVSTVSAALKGDPNAFKAFIKEAFAGIVPESVLQRRTKTTFSPAYAELMVASQATIRELVRSSILADIGVVETDRVLRVVDNLDSASMTEFSAVSNFIRAESWLKQMNVTHRISLRAGYEQEPYSISPTAIRPSNKAEPMQSAKIDDERLAMPKDVYAVANGSGSLIVMNLHTGAFHTPDVAQSNILRLIVAEGSALKAAEQLMRRYSHVDPSVIRNDVAQCVELFKASGLLKESSSAPLRQLPVLPKTPGFVSNEVVMEIDKEGANGSVADRVTALLAREIGNVVLRNTSRAVSFLRVLQKYWCTRETTYEEAERINRTVQLLPTLGRIACLERSLTAALAAALQRKTLEFHIGVSEAPLASHSWTAVRGKPVVTRHDGRVNGAFQSFFD